MSNKNQVAGQATVTIDGTRYSTSGETTLELGGKSREAVAGDYETGAFRESMVEAKLETTLLHKRGVSLTALRDLDDATVIVELDIGKTFILRNAYTVEPPSFGQDGKAKLVMQAPPAEEVL